MNVFSLNVSVQRKTVYLFCFYLSKAQLDNSAFCNRPMCVQKGEKILIFLNPVAIVFSHLV